MKLLLVLAFMVNVAFAATAPFHPYEEDRFVAIEAVNATQTTGIATGVSVNATQTTNIATNVTNIATNATGIATNVTNIATNATGIATNVTNIATNATGIATNLAAANASVIQLKGLYTVSGTLAAAATFAAGATIPARSIITGMITRVEDTIIAADSNTIAFGCGSGAGLLAATDFSAQSIDYIIPGTTTMPYLVDTECVVTGTIGAGASGVTAGAIEVYIQYVTLL